MKLCKFCLEIGPKNGKLEMLYFIKLCFPRTQLGGGRLAYLLSKSMSPAAPCIYLPHLLRLVLVFDRLICPDIIPAQGVA